MIMLMVCVRVCLRVSDWRQGIGWGWGVVGEWKWEDTPCRTSRLCHRQLHTGSVVKELWQIQDEQQRGGHVLWMCRMSMLMDAVYK